MPSHILNRVPSVATETDWPVDVAVRSGMLMAAPLPASVDLRRPWWEIGDQCQTGSCVGWAASDSVLRYHFAMAGRLAQDVHLSPRYLWMASKETDVFRTRATSFLEAEGTSVKAALDVARKYGVVLDADLPFASGKLSLDDPDVFYAKAARLKIAAYFNLRLVQSRWKTWLATKGPVLIGIDVDDAFENVKSDGLLTQYVGTFLGGHAVALVGYDARGFIVRNSWGTSWGDGGYAYMSTEYATGAIAEVYGVVV